MKTKASTQKSFQLAWYVHSGNWMWYQSVTTCGTGWLAVIPVRTAWPPPKLPADCQARTWQATPPVPNTFDINTTIEQHINESTPPRESCVHSDHLLHPYHKHPTRPNHNRSTRLNHSSQPFNASQPQTFNPSHPSRTHSFNPSQSRPFNPSQPFHWSQPGHLGHANYCIY